MSIMLRMPNLCTRCGENTPSIAYTIRQSRTDFNPLTILTIFVGIALTHSRKITLQVPLCETCQQQMTRQKWLRRLLIVAGGLMMVAGGWFVTVSPTVFSAIPFLVNSGARFNIPAQDFASLATILLGMIVIFIGSCIWRNRLVSINGETFRFHNQEFQKAFAELNPHLVKKSRWSRDTLAD